MWTLASTLKNAQWKIHDVSEYDICRGDNGGVGVVVVTVDTVFRGDHSLSTVLVIEVGDGRPVSSNSDDELAMSMHLRSHCDCT